MRKLFCSALAGLGFAAIAALAQQPAAPWVQGQNYFLIQPPQPTSVGPGKVEVTEVFSYACPACFQFFTVADRLKATLPANAELDFVPASFNPAEDWPMFQRAYYAAQSLGVAARTHGAMFNAVWSTGELAVVDPQTHRLKRPLPSIEDAARFYQHTAGVIPDQFLATAKSFAVEVKINRANALVKAYGADSTPTLVVNGKYRLTVQSAGDYDKTIALVKWLVERESHLAAAATQTRTAALPGVAAAAPGRGAPAGPVQTRRE